MRGPEEQRPSERGRVLLAGADADDGLDRADPDLAVADPTRLRGLDDDPDDVVGVGVVDDDLDADLRDQGDVVLRPPVDLGVALLAAVAADLGDRHPGDPEGLERLADVLPLVRLDHRGHELHALAPSVFVVVATGAVEAARTLLLPPLVPLCRSYADSPWATRSMPLTSSSSSRRRPIVYLIARAMTVVRMPE